MIARSLTLLTLVACYTEDPPTVDNDTWRWFPLNGERTWTYRSDDTTLPYLLVGSKEDRSEPWGDSTVRIHTITFGYDCQGVGPPCDVDEDGEPGPDLNTQVAFVWRLSADSSRGALFHGWDDTTFDPPVKIASASMFEGDEVVTDSAGVTYRSRYDDQGPCDVPYWRGSPPDDCITFAIEASGGGSPLNGTLQTIYQFGTTSFQLGGATAPWKLLDYDDAL